MVGADVGIFIPLGVNQVNALGFMEMDGFNFFFGLSISSLDRENILWSEVK